MGQREPDRFRVQGPTTPGQQRATPAVYELSVENARELDRLAVAEFGMDSIVLMENASIGLARHALEMIQTETEPSVVICCGPGNNGGDGFALARHLANALIQVHVITTCPIDAYAGDAGKNLTILVRMGIEISHADAWIGTDQIPTLIVDALFGTGLSRGIAGAAGELIGWINRSRARNGSLVLAVDVPSGLDAQLGEPFGESVVRSDRTVTFAGLKPGMSRVEALEYLGEVHIEPIGVPIELLERLGKPVKARHRDGS
jgi:hydroxyethylthiazole kinase-like uncharacterized protein yjeF